MDNREAFEKLAKDLFDKCRDGSLLDRDDAIEQLWQACTAHIVADRNYLLSENGRLEATIKTLNDAITEDAIMAIKYAELEQICGAMYVITGELLQANGQFDTVEGNKILDMLCNLKYDDSVLPFVAKVSK